MSASVRVAILDDHQSVIDGYIFRLSQTSKIQVVATARFGQDLDSLLAKSSVDVLILDVQVATSIDNPSPYPILHVIPNLLKSYDGLAVLVISMYNQPSLIKAVMDAGASGYILKDDEPTIKELGSVISTIAEGGIHLSQLAYQQLFRKLPKESILTVRQLQILSICAAYPDATTGEIADKLGVAHSTVRNLLSGAYLSLHVRSRASAVDKARHLGLITPPATMEY
ncbi:MAG TPA: response regulator transcription factor [Anaerolineales bacterium]|nr:response regulator transcription factor [Anaerolineales bacterium]